MNCQGFFVLRGEFGGLSVPSLQKYAARKLGDDKLTFAADKPPPEAVLQELHWEADPPAGFFPDPPVEYVP